MALTGLLKFCDYLNIRGLHIFDDSKVIINHIKSVHSIKNHNLLGWLSRIDSLSKTRKDYSIHHTDRGKNKVADALSKEGLSSPNELWKMCISTGDVRHHIKNSFCRVLNLFINLLYLWYVSCTLFIFFLFCSALEVFTYCL